MSSVIDNNNQMKHRTAVRVILYSKENVKTYEVKDSKFDI